MILKSLDKNKYGGFTWKIEVNNEFHFKIHETNESTYVVELKEAYYVMYRTSFTYLSNKTLRETIEDAFEKLYDFLLEKKKYHWQGKNAKKLKVLNLYDEIRNR